MMTDTQRDIVIGTVLGGSSLVKPSRGVNYYLSMRSKNQTWLQYKMQELEGYFQNCQLRQEKTTFRCNSMCSDEFTELHALAYEDKERTVSEDLLFPMKYHGLMVWFLEGGGRCGRGNKNIYLNTTKLRENGTDIVLDYFNGMYMSCTKTASSKRIRVTFTVEASEKYARIIEDAVPLFMIEHLYPS